MWARPVGDGTLRVGLTHVLAAALGDVVYVELPPPGTDVASGEPVGLVESSSMVCEVAAPLAGVVTAVNPDAETSPERVTDDPYGEGWLFAVRPADPGAVLLLLDADAYGRWAEQEEAGR